MTPHTDSEAVRQKVREGYGKIAGSGGSCCGPTPTCCGSTPGASEDLAKHIGYSAEELAALPEGANMGLSCGIVLKGKAAYIDGMVDWQDPLYQKIIAKLPPGAKPSDYITSLEVTARKPEENERVKAALTEKGEAALPLMLVDGQVIASGQYLNRSQLAATMGLASEATTPCTDKARSECCDSKDSPGKGSCCG